MRQISRRFDLRSIDVSLSKTRGFRPSDDPLISSLHSTFLLRSQATWALPQPKCKLLTLWENHPQDDLKILLRPWWPLLIRSLVSFRPIFLMLCTYISPHAHMFSCWWGRPCTYVLMLMRECVQRFFLLRFGCVGEVWNVLLLIFQVVESPTSVFFASGPVMNYSQSLKLLVNCCWDQWLRRVISPPMRNGYYVLIFLWAMF